MALYTKDKNTRITLRLNDEQFGFIKDNADIMGVSPSEMIRILINTTLATSKMALEKIKANGRANDNAENLDRGASGRENDETDQHNIV